MASSVEAGWESALATTEQGYSATERGRLQAGAGPNMMEAMDIASLVGDLGDEQETVDAVVAPLDERGWSTPTPAEGWDVRDSVSHLCYFDEAARLALTDPPAFAAHADALRAEPDRTADVDLGRAGHPAELLARWRRSRGELRAAVLAAPPGERVPWYGPAMSLASFVTARLMETWAHGQDVMDALGAPPVVTARLRHVCHIGVGARPYAFAVHGVEDPGDPVRVEAVGPGGERWTWGPDDAPDRITGTALDLALVLTQRRHRDDTDLTVAGPVAERWIGIAQSFAGPAGPGRRPGLGRVQ